MLVWTAQATYVNTSLFRLVPELCVGSMHQCVIGLCTIEPAPKMGF